MLPPALAAAGASPQTPIGGSYRRHTPSCMCSQTVLFDVSFPEKLLKTVATRGEIFSLKFTKYRLAAGLRLPSRNKGAYF